MNILRIKDNIISLKKSFNSEEEAYYALLTETLSAIYEGSKELKEKSNGIFESICICEVLSIRDIGKRIGDEANCLSALLLLITDGTSEVQAFEYKKWDINIEVGSRILLLPPFKIKRNLEISCC